MAGREGLICEAIGPDRVSAPFVDGLRPPPDSEPPGA
ncbi:MAG: hypothetical protein JWO62_3603 [Acidimicrobiaceae bacterium]|jgi:hypothetical protein|nr:hypothetical protein [Acidimicrobiaceae bacterium]